MHLSVPALRSPQMSRWLRQAAMATAGALALFGTTVAQAALPIEHWTAATGAQVYFVPSPSIPMLDINVDFDAGSRYDPAGKSGLATWRRRCWIRGGGGRRPAGTQRGADRRRFRRYRCRLRRLGRRRSGGIGLRTLTAQPELKQSVDLAAQLIHAPTYPDAVVAREKQRLITAIREGMPVPR